MSLPNRNTPVPEATLERLHPEERLQALTQKGWRQQDFVGGRLALAAAGARGPVLAGAGGEPNFVAPPFASVSHKHDLAVALVGPLGPLGVDLEDLHPPRPGIESRVLRPEERGGGWEDLITRFALKEAIYKAAWPVLRRWIGFEEATAEPTPNGAARLRLHTAEIELEGRWERSESRVIAAVRVLRAAPNPSQGLR